MISRFTGVSVALIVGLRCLSIIPQRALAAPNPVAWWSFDTDVQEGPTITDDTGNGHTATRNGGTTLVADGIQGQGISFDGTDGFLNVPGSLGNFGTGDFSISFWLKTTSETHMGIMGKRQFCFSHSFWDFRMSTDMGVELINDGDPQNSNNVGGLRILNDAIWHQVVLTRQGAEAILYTDGKFDGQSNKALVINLSNASDIWIARSRCTGLDGTGYFGGLMDEIRIYNCALTCDQVRAQFEQTYAVTDLNRDTLTDLADMLILADQWLETGMTGQNFNRISPADIAPNCGDGIVNLFDYAAMAEILGE